jgi:Glycosyltransferases, probably involved in cell wall biogenesis
VTILTIVIPTKNEGVNLKILCESLSRQSFKELFEVIIVDDSDPHYEKLVTSCISVLEDAGVKVRYLKGCGKGVGAAMLKGLEASNGRYVLFLDADNVLEENFMLEVMPLLVRGMLYPFFQEALSRRGSQDSSTPINFSQR